MGKTTARNFVLLVFSLLFYTWGEPVFVVLLLVCAFSDWLCALKHKEIAGIVLHILFLLISKYGNLIISLFGFGSVFSEIHLPLGISFYTFQGISYLADVRAGRVKAQKSFARLLLYISMFPQLIAGPIVRYSDIEESLDTRKPSLEDIAEGIWRIVCGLGKKVILADQLSLIVDQTMGGELPRLSTPSAWLGLLSFSLQIYFDFSAYSDMAIGMGRCMGFKFPENFDHPYISASATEFWRRWHISLGSFFRDYVYIPLGGSRKGMLRKIFNIMLVWALTGFWHGASFNFLIWGLYFGVLILVEKSVFFKDKADPKGRFLFIRHLITPFILMFGWGIFYYDDFGKMGSFFKVLFGRAAAGAGMLDVALLSQNAILIALALILCLPLPKIKTEKGELVYRGVVTVAVLVLTALFLIGSTSHPFLYTRF